MNSDRSGFRLPRFARQRVAPAHPDPADMGTAFGLELSLPDPDEPRVAPTPAPRSRWSWRRMGRIPPQT